MLVDLYSKKVFNMAFQFTGSFQESEDLTQDIFVKLYRSLDKFEMGKNFTAWMLTLAKNYLIDEYRRTKWEKKSRDDFEDHLPTLAGRDDPERGLAEEETRSLLWSGLNRLPADIRMAVILKETPGQEIRGSGRDHRRSRRHRQIPDQPRPAPAGPDPQGHQGERP